MLVRAVAVAVGRAENPAETMYRQKRENCHVTVRTFIVKSCNSFRPKKNCALAYPTQHPPSSKSNCQSLSLHRNPSDAREHRTHDKKSLARSTIARSSTHALRTSQSGDYDAVDPPPSLALPRRRQHKPPALGRVKGHSTDLDPAGDQYVRAPVRQPSHRHCHGRGIGVPVADTLSGPIIESAEPIDRRGLRIETIARFGAADDHGNVGGRGFRSLNSGMALRRPRLRLGEALAKGAPGDKPRPRTVSAYLQQTSTVLAPASARVTR